MRTALNVCDGQCRALVSRHPPRLTSFSPPPQHSRSINPSTIQRPQHQIIQMLTFLPTAEQQHTRCDTTLQKQQLHVIGAWPPLVVALSLFRYESSQHHRFNLVDRGDPNILELASTRLVEVAGGCQTHQHVRYPHYNHGTGRLPSRGAGTTCFTATSICSTWQLYACC
jgi:hypothetical protein